MIFTLCHAVKPKRALIPAPTFAEYGQALASTGCELEYYMLTENDGFVLSEAYLDILHKDWIWLSYVTPTILPAC